MTAKMSKFRGGGGSLKKRRFALLLVAIFLLAIPFLAAANSPAFQSVFNPVLAQVQSMFPQADDVFVPNEALTVTTSGIAALSGLDIRPEATTFSGGWQHSLAIRSDGTLWAWGHNELGQTGITGLAIGWDSNQLTPAQVGTATNWAAVSAGNSHSLAIKSDGTLWEWGAAASGLQTTPAQVGTATNWTQVSAGAAHSLAIRLDGTLWSWGSNNNGLTGLGIDFDYDTGYGFQTTPAQVGTATDWMQVSAGYRHSLAIKSDGTLWSWGWNTYGATGLGTAVGTQLTPAQVGTATTWTAVSAGSTHSLAIRSDGTLWAWGFNGNGRTGLGTTTGDQTTPAQVGTATNWTAVSAGGAHSHAVRSDGTLWAWGENANGMTGLGTTTGFQTTPTQVGTATNWATVSAAGNSNFHEDGYSLAIRSDGTLWSWGHNDHGRTGLGTTTGNQLTPAQVGTATNWAAVSAGWIHSLAIKSDGTLWAWGGYSATGLGTDTGIQTTPAQVGTATDWTQVAAGQAHSLAIRSDGSLWGWGHNYNGQLGLDDTDDRLVPTLITGLLPPEPEINIAVTKDLVMPAGTITPDASFEFIITPYSFNNNTARASELPALNTIDSIVFAPSDEGTTTGATKTVTKTSNFLLGDTFIFPAAGYYTYRISELSGTFTNTDTETMVFDQTEYLVSFLVERRDEQLVVTSIDVQQVVAGIASEDKAHDLVFTNVFTRRIDRDPLDVFEQTGLQISKEVTGTIPDMSLYFDFDLILFVPDEVTTPTPVIYRAYVVETIAGVPTVVTSSENGTIAGTSTSGDFLAFSHDTTQVISLKHRQTLVFVDTHVGTRYIAIEHAVLEYRPSVTLTIDGIRGSVITAAENAANVRLSTEEQMLGEAANRADFVNENMEVLPTGFVTGNFLTVLAVLAVAVLLVLLSASRRRHREMELQVLSY